MRQVAVIDIVLVVLSSVCCQVLHAQNLPLPTNWVVSEDSWTFWWSYSGLSGPAYWGLLNLDWFMCDKGRRQSPIDIDTRSLVYDPSLTPLKVDNNLLSGIIYNDGHAIIFNASASQYLASSSQQGSGTVNSKQNLTNDPLTKRRDVTGSGNIANPISDGTGVTIGPSDNILDELSNSVQLSLNQNERLESLSLQDKLSSINPVGSGDSLDLTEPANLIGDQNADLVTGIHFSGAGLAYTYRFEALYIRFGSDSKGSEHQIDSTSYSAELQLIAFNSVLYKNYDEASTKPLGLLAISALIDVQDYDSKLTPNSQVELLMDSLGSLKHRGASTMIQTLNVSALLPEMANFVTYEGSLTTPGCHESVTWLVLNKPLYITQQNLNALRSISADEQSSETTGTLVAGNIRPAQPLNERPIRTSIRPQASPGSGLKYPETCQRLRTIYQYKQRRNAKAD